jgi:hypothetical protein
MESDDGPELINQNGGNEMDAIGFLNILLAILTNIAFLYLLFGIPLAHILGRLGINRWWSLLTIVPIANLIGLWIFAYSDWPNARSRQAD